MQQHKKRLVVIGNGMAGARTVEEILARDGAENYQITMFGDEPYGNYNRILLSNVLNGSQDASEIFINPMEWYRENCINLHAGVRAVHINREECIVTGSDGTVEEYDRLIIATGSSPFVPPIQNMYTEEGCLRHGAFVFRTLDDCTRIAGHAVKCTRAVVIGGGLLGLEAARGLLNYGAQVTVVHNMPHIMNAQLDSEGAGVLQQTLERMGISFRLNAVTSRILGEDAVTGLEFDDASKIPCEMVVISAGIRPNTQLAKEAGLVVERGIVVDDSMRSVNDDAVYVVGECAQHRGQVYGLVAPIWDQAVTLADHITGKNLFAAYTGSKTAVKLKVMGVDLASMGVTHPAENDEVVVYSQPKKGIYKKLIIRDNQLAGAILLGDSSRAASLIQLFDRGTQLPEEREQMLFNIGSSANGASIQSTMLEMEDDTQVCNCSGVNKGTLRKCALSGIKTVKGVMEATRAGMGCGSCRPLVKEIVEWACEGQMDEDPSVHYYVPGVPLSKTDLVMNVKNMGLKSVSSVFNALANGIEDPGSKPGLASLLKTIWGGEYEDERDARFINDRVHANIQNNGTFSVVPRIYGGVTSPQQLHKIAEVAEKYDVPMVKITGGQRIDLLGIKKEDLPKVWKDLGMPSGHAYAKTFRTCKTCVGTDFCRYGLGDSTALGIKIEERFQGLESPAKLKLATAGCPRNCSEAMVKDVGAVAIEGGRWEIYVGGAAGAHVRKGDLLCTLNSHDEVLQMMGRFMQYYRENAKYLERTYGFVERIGIEKIRSVVVFNSEGTAERLDAAMQASVDAYKDPWLEAVEPHTPNQFAVSLPAGGIL